VVLRSLHVRYFCRRLSQDFSQSTSSWHSGHLAGHQQLPSYIAYSKLNARIVHVSVKSPSIKPQVGSPEIHIDDSQLCSGRRPLVKLFLTHMKGEERHSVLSMMSVCNLRLAIQKPPQSSFVLSQTAVRLAESSNYSVYLNYKYRIYHIVGDILTRKHNVTMFCQVVRNRKVIRNT
jgi:hypothetical protein